MKYITETHYCDLCHDEIVSYPFDPNLDFEAVSDNHAYVRRHDKYQIFSQNGTHVLACSRCCNTIRAAIYNGLVTMPDSLNEQVHHDAGYRFYNGSWIPLTLYTLKIEQQMEQSE